MIGAKLTTIQVPFLFKHAIDALTEQAAAASVLDGAHSVADATAPLTTVAGLLALSPASLLLMYGATTACASGMTQLRNALFARVIVDIMQATSASGTRRNFAACSAN